MALSPVSVARGACLVLVSCSAAAAQSLTGTGFLPGATNSTVYGVSADGSVAVGMTGVPQRAFRWTASGGMQDLGTLPGGTYAWGFGVSADGSVVAGTSGVPDNEQRAYRWTSAGGMQDITTTGGSSSGYAVSADGVTVVGLHNGTAFRWRQVGGMLNLGVLPGETFAFATAVSQDGAAVAGYSGTRAFRWTAGAGGGMADLGTLPGATDIRVHSISGDGTAVSGESLFGNSWHAFVWTAEAGMVDMSTGTAPGDSTFGMALSGDGSVMVGERYTDAIGTRPVIWTSGTGPQDLTAYLSSRGVDLAGWTLITANTMSPDGRVIGGEGLHNGITEGWVAVVPTPNAPTLLAAAGIGILAKRRARHLRLTT